jgi:hypothetical protein
MPFDSHDWLIASPPPPPPPATSRVTQQTSELDLQYVSPAGPLSPHQIPGSAPPPEDELDEEEEEEEDELLEPPDDELDDPPEDELDDLPPEEDDEETPVATPPLEDVAGSVADCDEPGGANRSDGEEPLHATIADNERKKMAPRFMADELGPSARRCPMPRAHLSRLDCRTRTLICDGRRRYARELFGPCAAC